MNCPARCALGSSISRSSWKTLWVSCECFLRTAFLNSICEGFVMILSLRLYKNDLVIARPFQI